MLHFCRELVAKAASYMKSFFKHSDSVLLSNFDCLLEWKAINLDCVTDASNTFEFFVHKYGADISTPTIWIIISAPAHKASLFAGLAMNNLVQWLHVNFWNTHDHSSMNHSIHELTHIGILVPNDHFHE